MDFMIWSAVASVLSILRELIQMSLMSDLDKDVLWHFKNRPRDQETLQPIKQKEPSSILESSLSYGVLL